MEVLNSTDVIGDEIKEEARKKVVRILKEADDEIERLTAKTNLKIAKLKEEQLEVYSAKIEQYKQSVFTTLPLEKWRQKVSYIEETLNDSLKQYFDALSVDKKLEIIKNMLVGFTNIVSNKTLVVKYSGFEKNEVNKLIHSVFSNCNIQEIRKAKYNEVRFARVFEGIIIEDKEQNFICKAGLEQAKEELFSKTKEKLAKVLFGGLL